MPSNSNITTRGLDAKIIAIEGLLDEILLDLLVKGRQKFDPKTNLPVLDENGEPIHGPATAADLKLVIERLCMLKHEQAHPSRNLIEQARRKGFELVGHDMPEMTFDAAAEAEQKTADDESNS